MTLPEQLRKWADNRARLRLDPRLLRRAAHEIETSRETIKEQFQRIHELEDAGIWPEWMKALRTRAENAEKAAGAFREALERIEGTEWPEARLIARAALKAEHLVGTKWCTCGAKTVQGVYHAAGCPARERVRN